ncbi:MAG: hypothetical protein ACYC3I_27190, partial [Gemmataceae bacterium]
PEDRQVGDDFHTQQSRFGGVHPFSLHTSSIPENHPEDKRTVCIYAWLATSLYRPMWIIVATLAVTGLLMFFKQPGLKGELNPDSKDKPVK